MKKINGLTKNDCMLMLDDYQPSIEVFIAGYTADWFITDLNKIFSYDSDNQASHQLDLWFSFLDGCRTNKYGF